MILALDLGTKTGWATKSDRGDLEWFCGTQKCTYDPRLEGGGIRYLRFRNFLETFGRPSILFYEEVRAHAGTSAAHVYGGFLAHLTAWCEAREVPYQGIPVGTVKKHATGKGNANKAAMLEAARKEWPQLQIEDDNAADALWVLRCGIDTMGL